MIDFAMRAIRGACLFLLPFALSGASVPKRPKVGEIAPDAELTLMDGTKLRLGDMRGDVVVLNFWATWCVPCRTELPTLDRYYAVQKRHGLRVYAVTTEDSLPLYKFKPLFGVLQIAPARKIKGPYGPIDGGVPTNYILDRSGKLRYAKAGAFTLDALNEQLVPLLSEPAPTP
ncbi:TlpA family protein disulfide reductase [Sphingomonas sp. MMS12-HWE2-04]|uniref:TlpA family protein disulfide reductase n=1 Tax=Sphingomonas sp. MMS12-HWE2-04 TaxID=3234199 RepID=UPI00384B135D